MKDILSYADVVKIEGFNIQKGINVRPMDKTYTILLMSVSENSPYNDGFDEKGEVLIYEGENVNIRRDVRDDKKIDPKQVDQPLFTKTGKLTNNGKLYIAAENFKYQRQLEPELVRVYEKLQPNIWSDKGWFELIDVELRYSETEKRKVFKYILQPKGVKVLIPEEREEFEFSRRIPTIIKREVWERDQGKCIQCDINENLHFDHIIPFAKGGSSLDSKNVQLLCGSHNLRKSDKIL